MIDKNLKKIHTCILDEIKKYFYSGLLFTLSNLKDQILFNFILVKLNYLIFLKFNVFRQITKI